MYWLSRGNIHYILTGSIISHKYSCKTTLLYLAANYGNDLGHCISISHPKSIFLHSKSWLDGTKTLRIVVYYSHRQKLRHANKPNNCWTITSYPKHKRRMLNRSNIHLANFSKTSSTVA